MHVFEIRRPGSWLSGIPDPDESQEAESLLYLLETALADAAVSLAAFEADYDAPLLASRNSLAQRDEDSAQDREIYDVLAVDLPPDLPIVELRQAEALLRKEAAAEGARRRWAAGRVPTSYTSRLPFLHARSCVYALDTIHKTLVHLSSKPSAPAPMLDIADAFEQAVPNLLDVRDSSHHAEDRVQGKARGRNLDLQPIIEGPITAPGGGVLVIDSLNGNRYGGTVASGSYAEVEISYETVALAQRAIQQAFDAYQWTGQPTVGPR